MAMTTQPIKNDQAVAQIVSRQTTPPQTSHLASKFSPAINGSEKSDRFAASKDLLSGSVTAPAKEATSRLAALQGSKETSDLQVLAVRTSKAVEERMESVREKLNEIVNSYPPFLRGSEKRQQYLMSISSIRDQIEAMTIPPIKVDKPSLDSASGNGAKQMWAQLFDKIDIPALEANGANEASDAQIRAASSAVGAMKSDLSGRRATLERQLVSSPQISTPIAQQMSQVAEHGLAATDLSLTANLKGVLRSL
ncbi:MAG: hypothetical protein PHD54_10865 [Desulfuromonadaceae bacterium]|nr:hypothetical protein [Desulfuromonadaceae bacterium]